MSLADNLLRDRFRYLTGLKGPKKDLKLSLKFLAILHVLASLYQLINSEAPSYYPDYNISMAKFEKGNDR